jgi:hypothetical protein
MCQIHRGKNFVGPDVFNGKAVAFSISGIKCSIVTLLLNLIIDLSNESPVILKINFKYHDNKFEQSQIMIFLNTDHENQLPNME